MTPKNFVDGLHTTIVEENSNAYWDLFTNTAIEDSSDPYWKQALTFFSELSEGQRKIFFSVIRQVTVDTTSNVLGVIDGVNIIPGNYHEFKLSCDGDDLSGDLQSLFLVKEE